MEPKSSKRAATQGDKDQKNQPNLNANLNSNWASKNRATRCGLTVSKNMAVQVSLWGLAVTPALRAQ